MVIKQSIIFAFLLLLVFIPTRPGIIWRTGSTAALILGANWMHLRVERTERIQAAVLAQVTGKSVTAIEEDYPPVGLVEPSREFVNNVREYIPVDAITAGLKTIFEDEKGSKKNNLKKTLNELIDPSGASKDDEEDD